jgi:mannose-6-phosphate isomerase-like protein (cupin superfamily)
MKKPLGNDFVPKILNNVYKIYPPEGELSPYLINHYDITYIVKGKALYTIDGKNFELGKGDLLCLTEGVEKAAEIYPKNQMHCFTVNFDSLYPESKSHQFSQAPPPTHPLLPPPPPPHL